MDYSALMEEDCQSMFDGCNAKMCSVGNRYYLIMYPSGEYKATHKVNVDLC